MEKKGKKKEKERVRNVCCTVGGRGGEEGKGESDGKRTKYARGEGIRKSTEELLVSGELERND